MGKELIFLTLVFFKMWMQYRPNKAPVRNEIMYVMCCTVLCKLPTLIDIGPKKKKKAMRAGPWWSKGEEYLGLTCSIWQLKIVWGAGGMSQR